MSRSEPNEIAARAARANRTGAPAKRFKERLGVLEEFIAARGAKRTAEPPGNKGGDAGKKDEKNNIRATAAEGNDYFEAGDAEQYPNGNLAAALPDGSNLRAGQETKPLESCGVIDAGRAAYQ